MRADAHYVDLLESRSSDARGQAAPLIDASAYSDQRADSPAKSSGPARAAARVEMPDPALHAGRDLAQSLATLSACVDLLTGAPSDLSRAVAGNLVRAEMWRASSLLYATRVVRQELPMARTALPILGVLDRVQQGFQPERRVRSLAIDTQPDVPHGAVMAGDEQMLVGALACAVLATLALLEGVQDARLTVSARAESNGHITFGVAQDIMTMPGNWCARAFDPQWTDRTGGVPALVSMLAIQRVAEAHGGTALVTSPGRGTSIVLSVPAGI